jgi:hypothetical protein
MSFGVKKEASAEEPQQALNVVKAITTETIVALILVAGIFAVFTWKMGVAFTFKRPTISS